MVLLGVELATELDVRMENSTVNVNDLPPTRFAVVPATHPLLSP